MSVFKITDIELRPERKEDYRETENVTREAFWNLYTPGCDEHYLLNIMRFSLSFIPELHIVAVYGDRIIGNAAYMKTVVKNDNGKDNGVLGLGPIAVLPQYQNSGIGGKLIEYSKSRAREMGYKAVFLYGNPAYYSKHGFLPAESFLIRTEDNMFADALQVCPLYAGALSGISGRYIENRIFQIDASAASEFDKSFPEKEKLSGTPSQKEFKRISALRKKAF